MQGARLAAVAAEVGVQRGVAASMTGQGAMVVLQNSWGYTRPAAHITPRRAAAPAAPAAAATQPG